VDHMSRLRRWTTSIVLAVWDAGEAAAARTALLVWRWCVAQRGVHSAVEQVEREEQQSQARCEATESRLHLVQAEMAHAMDTHKDEMGCVESEIRSAESEMDTALAEMRDREWSLLEVRERHREVEHINDSCQSELASAEAKYLQVADRLKEVYDFCERDELTARKRLAESEEMVADARRNQEMLQAELVEHRDGRVSDLKEVKAHARAQLLRCEAAEREHLEARGDASSSWSSRLGVSDSRRRQLEQQLRSLQRDQGEVTPEVSRLEVRRQRLRQRLAKAKSRLAAAEASTPQSEIAELARRNEEASRRCDELTQRLRQRRQGLQPQDPPRPLTPQGATAFSDFGSVTASPCSPETPPWSARRPDAVVGVQDSPVAAVPAIHYVVSNADRGQGIPASPPSVGQPFGSLSLPWMSTRSPPANPLSPSSSPRSTTTVAPNGVAVEVAVVPAVPPVGAQPLVSVPVEAQRPVVGMTASKAAALWRQRALHQRAAERQSLEEMRRHYDALIPPPSARREQGPRVSEGAR